MSGYDAHSSPSDRMMADAHKWLELALYDDREFQQRLGAARNAETISFEDAMTLANAALMVADSHASPTFGPWYRECATLLFCRAYDVVAVEREAHMAAEAGQVQ